MKTFNPLVSSITSLKSARKLKPSKPSMHIHFNMSDSEVDYDKQEIDRLKSEIKALEKHKSSLTPDGALSHMHNAIDAELMQMRGRSMALQGRTGKK